MQVSRQSVLAAEEAERARRIAYPYAAPGRSAFAFPDEDEVAARSDPVSAERDDEGSSRVDRRIRASAPIATRTEIAMVRLLDMVLGALRVGGCLLFHALL